eukprot:Tamp_03819.p1 GENE.Tamp_03819~~Tamp_03819.p1  ORF type:complete len:347 (+),score=33.33 Tamp_03819:615-1655(+)
MPSTPRNTLIRYGGRALEGDQERSPPASVPRAAVAGQGDGGVGQGDWEERSLLEPPFPHVLIASGRTTAPASVAVKRASAGAAYSIQIQDPRSWRQAFDAIVTPLHDLPSARRAQAWQWLRSGALFPGRFLPCVGSLNDLSAVAYSPSPHRHEPISAESLQSSEGTAPHAVHAADAAWSQAAPATHHSALFQWIRGGSAQEDVKGDAQRTARAQEMEHLPQPELVAVLLGAPTRHCRWTLDDVLRALDVLHGGGTRGAGDGGQAARPRMIAISLSRRSSAEVVAGVHAWASRALPGTCRCRLVCAGLAWSQTHACRARMSGILVTRQWVASMPMRHCPQDGRRDVA